MGKLFATIIAALFFGVALAQLMPAEPPKSDASKNSERRGDKNTQATTDKKIPNPTPPDIEITRPGYLDQYSEYCDKEPSPKDKQWRHKMLCEKSTDVVIAAFTIALTLVTALLVLIGWIQWRLSRDSARRQLRAYALVKMISLKNEVQQDGTTNQIVLVSVTNFGHVPAKHLTYWLDIADAPLRLTKDLEKSKEIQPARVAVIAPGDTFTIRCEIPLLATDFEIHAGRNAMYIFGQITYNDGFTNGQTTDFRFMRAGKGWENDGELDMCQGGNDAT